MKHLATLFAVLLALTAPAADHPELARVTAANDARVAAMLAPTREKLDAVSRPTCVIPTPTDRLIRRLRS